MLYDDVVECLKLELRAPTKHVMTVIAFKAKPSSQQADITIPQFMDLTGLSKSAIQRAIKELELEGLITAARGSGRGSYSVFQVHMERVQMMIPDPFENMLDNLPKGVSQTPLEGELKGVSQTPLGLKGVSQGQKGVSQGQKGVSQTPLNKEKINKHARAYTRTREGKGAAVNRGYATGRELYLEDGGKIGVYWSKDLDAETVRAWQDACRILAQEIGTKAYRSWFAKCFLGGLHDGTATLITDTGFIADWIKREYSRTLLSVLKRLFGDDIQLKIEKEVTP